MNKYGLESRTRSGIVDRQFERFAINTARCYEDAEELKVQGINLPRQESKGSNVDPLTKALQSFFSYL